MDFDKNIELYSTCLKKWGVDIQINIAMEECGELIQALSHWKRGRNKQYDVIEELVDVQIMIEQMVFIFKAKPDFEQIYKEKIDRLKRRVEGT